MHSSTTRHFIGDDSSRHDTGLKNMQLAFVGCYCNTSSQHKSPSPGLFVDGNSGILLIIIQAKCWYLCAPSGFVEWMHFLAKLVRMNELRFISFKRKVSNGIVGINRNNTFDCSFSLKRGHLCHLESTSSFFEFH